MAVKPGETWQVDHQGARLLYPETRESTIERRALDAAGQWAEVASRLEAECQRLRARVAELEERIAALGRVPR